MINRAWRSRAKQGALRAALKALSEELKNPEDRRGRNVWTRRDGGVDYELLYLEAMINGAWRSRAKQGALRAALKGLPEELKNPEDRRGRNVWTRRDGGVDYELLYFGGVFEEAMINGAWRSRAKQGPFAPRCEDCQEE